MGWFKIKARTNLGPQNYMYLSAPGHSPPMLMITSIKLRKKSECYFPRIQNPAEGQPFNLHQVLASSMSPHFTVWYGTFTLTSTILAEVERCQQWFLKNVFYVSKFAPSQLLLKLSGLLSIDSEIGLRKLLFLGRLLIADKMAPVNCP